MISEPSLCIVLGLPSTLLLQSELLFNWPLQQNSNFLFLYWKGGDYISAHTRLRFGGSLVIKLKARFILREYASHQNKGVNE